MYLLRSKTQCILNHMLKPSEDESDDSPVKRILMTPSEDEPDDTLPNYCPMNVTLAICNLTSCLPITMDLRIRIKWQPSSISVL